MHSKDPIYGPISIHDRDILRFIDTKVFQRLAYIKQQGHTYFLHENAIHTKKEHSIGVYVLVSKVIEHLTEIGDIHLSEYERKLLSAVALLHDVGHGPYSHCFQKISGEDHGDWTIRIIQEDEEIRTILNQTSGLLENVTEALTDDEVFLIIVKCFVKSEDVQLAALIQIYFSVAKSLSFEKGLEGDFKKENSTLAVITEKKVYSSYVGGIYVYSEGQLEDIIEKSTFIQGIVKLPKKEYTYSI
ncbi:HD domain-containing protein [Bacillus thuringiensis]|nr:HD domain-containing protein [Bacillus thuringiensis]